MIDNDFQPPDDDGTDKPGTVRRQPGGRCLAVRIHKPAAWILISVTSGLTQWVSVHDEGAAELVDWPML